MKKILLVEDELIVSGMYKRLLVNHNYDVIVAKDGSEGLKMALDNKPDLILLDIHMPKIDGMEMMRQLRKDEWGKSAKIIILNNLDTNDERLIGVVRDQPTYYLIKSSNPPQKVLEKVDEIVNTEKEKDNT